MSKSLTSKNPLQEIGKVAGTHGVRGELRIEPWCDSPAFLAGFETVHLLGQPYKVQSARPHKSLVLMKLDGVDTVEAAQMLRGSILYIDRSGVELPEGRHFIQDLVGLSVLDGEERIGTLYDVLTAPAHDVYVVRGEDGERMIPAVPEFVKEIDIDGGVIRVKLIEGM
ncbi:MAG: ribosome maturation factor RimM [Oscillospiraceae bacterium]|jgi:16S rRNA processing protein RimM|nr:ribosome maturation factor RimM [Oscillospiraceae bacterium]